MMEIRCSKLARIMSCAGILAFENLPDEESGEPAREGTAAGEMLERILTNQPLGTHARNGKSFDDDMKFYTVPIAQEIVNRAQSEVLCEQRIDWTTRSGITIRGQPDISYVFEGDLCIDDLKYGWGLVEVRDNWQLLGYAIGEVIRRQMHFPKIRLRILQPRPHHEDGDKREWVLTYEELLAYKEKIEDRMLAIATGERKLVTGPQCKYCPAAGEQCAAFSRAFYSSIDYIQEFVQDNISDKELSHQLDIIARVHEVMKIKKDSIEALAKDRISKGRVIPNYTTENSYGDRSWKEGISPRTIEVLTGKKIVKEEMLSPAQAEKVGVPKEIVNSLVNRFFKGQKLVRKDSNVAAEKVFGKQP